MERRWKIWKELLEEVNGELEEEIRSLFLERKGECGEEAGRRRRMSSSVAESLDQDRDFPLRLICGLAHCCRRTEREREREEEEELEGQSTPPVL